MTSTETPTGTDVETASDAPLAKPVTDSKMMTREAFTAWLAGADISEDDDTDELSYEQAVRIFDATDQADVLGDEEIVKGEDLVGQTFTVLSFTWRKSTKSESGAGRYALIRAVNADGEAFLTSIGATKVVLQLRKAELEGWLPWQVQLDAVETNNNRTMLQLIAPEKPF